MLRLAVLSSLSLVRDLSYSFNSPITRKPLSKLDPIYHGKLLIGGVYRDGGWQIAVGNTHVAANERVIGVCLSMQLKEMRKLFAV